MGIGNRLGYSFNLYTGNISEALGYSVAYEMTNALGRELVHILDSEIYPGDSGGPLVNASGEVIGIARRIDQIPYANQDFQRTNIEIATASESIRKALYDYQNLGMPFESNAAMKLFLDDRQKITDIKGPIATNLFKYLDSTPIIYDDSYANGLFAPKNSKEWRTWVETIGYGEEFTIEVERGGKIVSEKVKIETTKYPM